MAPILIFDLSQSPPPSREAGLLLVDRPGRREAVASDRRIGLVAQPAGIVARRDDLFAQLTTLIDNRGLSQQEAEKLKLRKPIGLYRDFFHQCDRHAQFQ
jgi:hypothetical protein